METDRNGISFTTPDGLFRITIRNLNWGIGIYVTGLWYGGPLIQRFVKGT